MSEGWTPFYDQRHVEVTDRDTVYDGFFKLQQLRLRYTTFAGGDMEITRELFYRDDAVCVLLYDPRLDEVVMIEQFRIGTLDHPHSPWLLELVAGIVERGESAADVAHREAAEEAGAELQALIPISRYSVSPGGSREYIDLFCACVDASVISGDHGLAEEGEDIRVHRIPVQQAFQLVRCGRIDNAASIIALQWLQLNFDTVKAEFLKLQS
ncbi:NUDIX domain-containing protein [Marinobacterium jannaschii]|uniref:NUDIX domain-containing protein n=1 Tax=Marinobacterium jannaschii TaxID=64970 RepID=UPI000489458C|nr:NUDIX domain-containing protein [Marinobacterium jannaschii]